MVGDMTGRDALGSELEMTEWRERLARRPETDLGVDAATLVREERSRRAEELWSRHSCDHVTEGDRMGDGEGAGLR